jgi:DNA-binding response OmpR family regulator
VTKKILVADDDPAIQKVLFQTFQLEGYEVATASDGEEALAELEGELPDLVVLDVMMPKLDGFDVLKRIREDPRTKALPVILLSARSSQEDIWQGWQSGVDYYMTKPFDVEDLLKFLEHVLSPKPPEDPEQD